MPPFSRKVNRGRWYVFRIVFCSYLCYPESKKEGEPMSKTKKPKIKASRTQLLQMRKQVLIHMAVCMAAVLLLILSFLGFLDIVGIFSGDESGGFLLLDSTLFLFYGLAFLILSLFPILYFLWHLLPKYRRIEAALSPEDYRKWMQLSKTATHKLPKDDIQTAHRIYKEYRLQLPLCSEELTLLLKSELKRDWYRRLTIAMLCGLLLNCPDFTDTNLLHRAMTERKSAAQFIFPAWIECMEGRTIHSREIIARQFLTHWDKKLFPRR